MTILLDTFAADELLLSGSTGAGDYDLTGFSTHKVGAAIRLSPFGPIAGIKDEENTGYVFSLASASFRYAYYTRSDGFRANSFSVN